MEAALTRFNTPNQKNINQLFKDTLNIPKISAHWTWEEMTPEAAGSVLDSVLLARHEIAHTGATGQHLSKKQNVQHMETLVRMAQLMEEGLNGRLNVA